MLDGNDVTKLVECAIRHPAVNMQEAVLAAIWNHPHSFRQIFQFHLKAPRGFSEIRKIVAEELAKPIAYTGIFGFEHSQASCGAATASHAAAGPSARSREALVAPRGRGGDIDEKTKAGVKSDPKTAGATYGIPADLEA
jgi:hypothetical protein